VEINGHDIWNRFLQKWQHLESELLVSAAAGGNYVSGEPDR